MAPTSSSNDSAAGHPVQRAPSVPNLALAPWVDSKKISLRHSTPYVHRDNMVADSTFFPAAEYIASTYLARLMQRTFFTVSDATEPLPSSPLVPQGGGAHRSPPDPSSVTVSSSMYDYVGQVFHSLFACFWPSPLVCEDCPADKGCLLVRHALGPCPCPNDYRFPAQTEPTAWHSKYCMDCKRNCLVCTGPSSQTRDHSNIRS
ncbi:hypothetical protein R3P38DRAFT_1356326 [Favolaschia claudopus]|uniref:Uncharacterized protein n=1 Tax=Favolaschia claudopus TaxID=2862362 RepID=A0AAW0DTK8_9AGAR